MRSLEIGFRKFSSFLVSERHIWRDSPGADVKPVPDDAVAVGIGIAIGTEWHQFPLNIDCDSDADTDSDIESVQQPAQAAAKPAVLYLRKIRRDTSLRRSEHMIPLHDGWIVWEVRRRGK